MSKNIPDVLFYHDEEKEIRSFAFEDAINGVVKTQKVKDFSGGDELPDKKARDVVKDFFLMHLKATTENAAELPEGLEKYENLFEHIKEKVEDHNACVTEEKDKAIAAKKLKDQQKEVAEKQKAAEAKHFAKQGEAFDTGFGGGLSTREPMDSKILSGITKQLKMPTGVSFTANNMGVIVGEKVSTKDIGDAFSLLLGAMQGKNALQSALQFATGDLMNKAVEKKVFESKGAAAAAIRAVMSKNENVKSWDVGTIQFYANMAERIPADKRLSSVNPTVYLAISKATMPRIKKDSDGKDISKEQLAVLGNEFDEFRDSLTDAVNEGSLVSIKDVQAKVKEFKESKGILKKSPQDEKAAELAWHKQLFFAVWAIENVVSVHKKDIAMFKKTTVNEADKTTTEAEMEVPLSELVDLRDEALNALQATKISNVTEVTQGWELIEDAKTKTKKKAPFYMEYPFGSDAEEVEEQQEQAAETQADAPSAEADDDDGI